MLEPLTIVDADNLVEQLAACRREIASVEKERDKIISNIKDICQRRISAAENNCRLACGELHYTEREILAQLEQFYDDNPPKRRKSILLTMGTLSKSKVHPKFYDSDDKELTNDNKILLAYVKEHLPENYVKTTIIEKVDLRAVKSQLLIGDDGTVSMVDGETGELVEIKEFRGQTFPDKFDVAINKDFLVDTEPEQKP